MVFRSDAFGFRAVGRSLGFICLLVSMQGWADDDSGALRVLVDDFLANADKLEAHQRFWTEDLIYTSSAGARFGKSEILDGFEKGADASTQDDGRQESEAELTSYRSEDMQIRVMGDVALVAFKLVADTHSNEGSEQSFYFNTGTFVKRSGEWRAMAWQATRIPSDQ